MIREILPLGKLRCNCSIFGDEASKEAVVVDPGDNVPEILAVLEKHSLRVKAIVITHAHIDHIGGAYQLREVTGAPVHMNPNDAYLSDHLVEQAAWIGVPVPRNPGIDSELREGDTVTIGATAFHILETPGHTQGSISLSIPSENTLVAGDTLFRDSIGRTDLPGGDSKRILESIYRKLLILADETIVIAGHGMSTTIGREKKFNPFLRATGV